MSDAEKKSTEQALYDVRKAKAEALRKAGRNPFANDARPLEGGTTLDLAEVRAQAAAGKGDDGKYDLAKVHASFGGTKVHVRGRIVALRQKGMAFLKVRDRTGELQLLLSEAPLDEQNEPVLDGTQAPAWDELEHLDLADVVEAEGFVTATKRGELSLRTTRLRLLTKAYRPLPDKWHGLSDVETRYRQRYVDLVANPDVAETFRARSHIVRAIRKSLDERGFLEVETPSLHTLVGGAAARPFSTHHNALDMGLFLRIAPELHLKRLVVGGLERVYEIARCYRNEGVSTRHNPEFTMLEFYWAYATYDTLMDFAEVLFREVDAELARAMPDAHLRWKEARAFTLDEPFVRLPMADAVALAARKTGIADWIAACDQGGAPAFVALLGQDFGDRIKEWSKSSPRAKGLDWGNFRKGYLKCENDGERLFALYEYLAEPFLKEDWRSKDGAKSVPVLVKDYPFETSPLARKNDAAPHLVDRFELFVEGRELGNAFSELNDPDDQRERFLDQVRKKSAGADETMDFDEDYVRALDHGMPPAAGFGLGIDRLVMALTNAPSIRDVILFPLLRPEIAKP